MMTTRLGAAGMLLLALVGCQAAGSGTVTLETEDQKASYSIGLDIGRNLSQIESHVDQVALRAGIEDALAENEPRLSDAEIQQVMASFTQMVQAENQAAMAAESQQNREEGDAYLAENGARPEVTTTESGLQYEVLREGDGPRPGPDDTATLHYRGTLIDGTEFDTSYDREPTTLGVSQFIAGFSEALQLMPVGSHYRFVIPSDIAYGPGGSGSIGPNSTLIFEVELLDIQ